MPTGGAPERRRARLRRLALPVAVVLAVPLLALTPGRAGATTPTTFSFPGLNIFSITAGSDGALWLTVRDTATNEWSIKRMTLGGRITATYKTPEIPYPSGLFPGPDGALWFVDDFAEHGPIGRITTSGVISTYSSPTLARPGGFAIGPDGALWFANGGTFVNGTPTADKGSIGRITMDGTISNFRDPTIKYPGGVTAGPDGALWFDNTGGSTSSDHGSIGRITTAGVVTNYTDPSIQYPGGITLGPDGALWFNNYANKQFLARMTVDGTVTAFDPAVAPPSALLRGPDGALWYDDDSHIGRMTATGAVPDASIDGPEIAVDGLTFGADGALWLAGVQDGEGVVARLTTSLTPAAPQNAAASPQPGRAVLSWMPPSDTGSPPVTGYEVIPFIGRVPQTPRMFPGDSTGATLSGLTNGKSYRFRVAALDANGTGAFTPLTYPVIVGPPSSWKILPSPAPPNPSDGPLVLATVACTSTTNCFAAGYRYTSSSGQKPLAEHWDGNSWSLVPTTSPPGGRGHLNAIACASPTTCFGVGQTDSSSPYPVIERYNGTNFVLAGTTFAGQLRDIACPAPKHCFAIGARGNPSHELVEQWNGSKWTVLTTPNVTGKQLPFSIACPNATTCIILTGGGALQTWNGTTWSAFVSPKQAPAVPLQSLACTSATSCFGVGGRYEPSSRSFRTFTSRWNGRTWSTVASPNQPDLAGSLLSDVTCTSATNCVAVGSNTYRHEDGSTQDKGGTLIEHWNGKAWSLVESPNPHGLGALSSVACSTSTHCVAVGSTDTGQTLIEHS